MNELFREIEDDIRQEKLDRLWRKVGRFMVGASIAVVVGTIITVIVQNHRQAQAMQQTARFVKGVYQLGIGDYKGAIRDFAALSADPDSPYYGLAKLREGQAQSAGGDKDGAIKTYQELAAHGGTFGALAAMQPGTGNIVSPDSRSPFYYTQSEGRGWQLMSAGKKDEAVAQFLALRADAGAPYSLRQRMQSVVQQLAPEKADASMPR